MSTLRFTLAAAVLIAAAVGAGWGIGRWRESAPAPTGGVARGALVYQIHCASCHGPEGRGDGNTSVQPRDFASRPWIHEPTPESIRRVTLDGLPGKAMPGFRATLSAADLDVVVQHVHRLATLNPAPSADTRLLAAAGFANLHGAAPPPLKATDAAGATIDWPSLRGRLVILHFWGTGCTHCIKEIPSLQEIEKASAGKLAVVHICADDDDAEAAQLVLDRLAPGAHAYVEPTGIGLARFDVQSLPTVWLISPDGAALGRSSGARDWRSPAIEALVARHLPK